MRRVNTVPHQGTVKRTCSARRDIGANTNALLDYIGLRKQVDVIGLVMRNVQVKIFHKFKILKKYVYVD